MTKKLCVLALLAGLLLPSSASAHELLKDQAGSAGALLHLSPDDNPGVGQRTTLFFDISDGTVTAKSSHASLTITDERHAAATVPTVFTGSSLSATYAFRHQGLYKVQLTIRQGGATTHIFSESLLVGRASVSAPAWAKVGIGATVLAAFYLAAQAFMRRKAISRYSKL